MKRYVWGHADGKWEPTLKLIEFLERSGPKLVFHSIGWCAVIAIAAILLSAMNNALDMGFEKIFNFAIG